MIALSRLSLLALLTLVLCAIASPGTSLAVEYTVDTTLDEVDDNIGVGGCHTSADKCSLSAAIQESNFSTAVDDTIKFAPSFDGQLDDTIAIGNEFPPITDKVSIDGDSAGQCTTAAAGAKGPCVGVEKIVAGHAFVVENADGVTIEGLAVTNALGAGINVLNSSEGFTARDNWLGLKLNGEADENQVGIFLDPNSNGARIGGVTPAERNVFGNNSFVGLDIQGASNTEVWGNYFGVKPDGTSAAPNGKNLELTSSFTVEAIGNEIGRDVSLFAAEAPSTPACDGGCNVFGSQSLSTSAIDLKGDGIEEPPSRSTTINGNYIGLDAEGDPFGPGSTAPTGVLVAGADEVLIGGDGAGAANHINGGAYGVLAGTGADDLVIDDNMIGLNVAGTTHLSPPTTAGIFNSSEGLSNIAKAAEITDNRISMSAGAAIEQHSVGALISGNEIGHGGNGNLGGGTSGIRLLGSVGGSIVEANEIEHSTGNGILIENENNQMVGNTIEDVGMAGIRIQTVLPLPSPGNAIGGDTGPEENTISGSGGDAIEVVGGENSDEQIGRNNGSGNLGLFIDLGGDGAGNKLSGPNDGIQAPTISAATVSGASGTGARPGATVRVFRKAGASPGELQSFLGKATADGKGNWSVSYGSAIPGGTNIGATQSDVEGTSELAFALTSSPSAGGGGDSGDEREGKDKDKGQDKDKSKGKDKKAPETTIVAGPRARSHKRTAKFKFVSNEPNSTFQCKLDRRPFNPCRSAKRYKRLKPGKHVFQVRAIDAAGNRDKTPATRKFRILPRR